MTNFLDWLALAVLALGLLILLWAWGRKREMGDM